MFARNAFRSASGNHAYAAVAASRRCRLSSSAPTARTPMAEDVQQMPTHISELSGEALYILSRGEGSGKGEAVIERLRREVMRVDSVSYEEAARTVQQISSANDAKFHTLGKLPFFAGIMSAQVAGWASLPLVFSKRVSTEFNHHAVTTEVPAEHEMETMLEVGMWSWGWMEPPLGTISFFLLCMQFARDQRVTLGMHPFERYKKWRAKQLIRQFPKYDTGVLRDFAITFSFESAEDAGLLSVAPTSRHR